MYVFSALGIRRVEYMSLIVLQKVHERFQTSFLRPNKWDGVSHGGKVILKCVVHMMRIHACRKTGLLPSLCLALNGGQSIL